MDGDKEITLAEWKGFWQNVLKPEHGYSEEEVLEEVHVAPARAQFSLHLLPFLFSLHSLNPSGMQTPPIPALRCHTDRKHDGRRQLGRLERRPHHLRICCMWYYSLLSHPKAARLPPSVEQSASTGQFTLAGLPRFSAVVCQCGPAHALVVLCKCLVQCCVQHARSHQARASRWQGSMCTAVMLHLRHTTRNSTDCFAEARSAARPFESRYE